MPSWHGSPLRLPPREEGVSPHGGTPSPAPSNRHARRSLAYLGLGQQLELREQLRVNARDGGLAGAGVAQEAHVHLALGGVAPALPVNLHLRRTIARQRNMVRECAGAPPFATLGTSVLSATQGREATQAGRLRHTTRGRFRVPNEHHALPYFKCPADSCGTRLPGRHNHMNPPLQRPPAWPS